mmetsp:Transcript_23308/g.59601  ORF Transcript_23308/g.59601 Transcript_23308/m.59601 type:complete len:366 (-) Transcript_23308:1235-2332(-)
MASVQGPHWLPYSQHVLAPSQPALYCLSSSTTVSTWLVCGNRSHATALTGAKGVQLSLAGGPRALPRPPLPPTSGCGGEHSVAMLSAAFSGLHATNTRRLSGAHLSSARSTLRCRPARGGSTTATTSSPSVLAPPTCLASSASIRSSARPHTYVALVMPLSAALASASATALATLSTPTTRAHRAAMVRPMVPVPQHTSSSSVLGPGAAQSATSLYSRHVVGELTWKKAVGEMRKRSSHSESWMATAASAGEAGKGVMGAVSGAALAHPLWCCTSRHVSGRLCARACDRRCSPSAVSSAVMSPGLARTLAYSGFTCTTTISSSLAGAGGSASPTCATGSGPAPGRPARCGAMRAASASSTGTVTR